MIISGNASLKNQEKNILTSAELNNDISTIESVLAGLGSGLIQIPKGVFSLGASLIDLGAGTNKAAQVEKYFDDLTTLDEKAAATTAGKIAEALVNIGVPGGIGFKIGTKLAQKALTSKKAGTYFQVAKEPGKKISKTANELAKLNVKGRAAKFGVGAITGGMMEGIFVGNIEDYGTFGDLLGGPTKLHRTEGEEYDPGRALLNRVKFGTDGALFTGLLAGTGKTLKLIAGRNEKLRFADNKLDKSLFKLGTWFQKEGGTTKEFFETQRQLIGKKYADINAAQQFSRQLNTKVDALFPFMQRMFETSTKTQRKELLNLFNDGLTSGKPTVKENGSVIFKEISDSHKTAARKFLNNKKISHTKEQLDDIFNDMNSIRSGWGKMFTMLGQDMKQLGKRDKKYKKAFKEYKKIFGDKFKDYLGSTYEAFENKSLIPFFTKKIPTEIAEKAAAVFMKSARAAGSPITWQEALTAVDNVAKTAIAPGLDRPLTINLPEYFLKKSAASKVTQEYSLKQLPSGAKGGYKRELVEEVLGKTRDPVQTILAATGEVSAVTRRNQLMTQLADSSMKALKTEGSRPLVYDNMKQVATKAAQLGDSWDQTMYRKIQGFGMSSGIENPMVGKYALKEIADGLEFAMGREKDSVFTRNLLYRNLILFPKATSQMAKTILSVPTHMRNFFSAGAFAVANGIIPNPKHLPKTWGSLQVATGLGTRKENYNELYRELTALGVVNTNVRAGDLQAIMKDVDFGSIVGADRALRGMFKYPSKAKQWLQDAYTAEDDFWKITSFFGERSRLENAYKNAGVFRGMKPEAIKKMVDEEAASIVRNNIPNYDYVSDVVKELRQLPIGNFVSFPAEILRTSTNVVKRALHEINYVAENGTKPLAAIGYQRLAGMTFVAGAVPQGAVALGQYLWDVSEDELMALKRFVAPWSKNSTIVPIKDPDTGEFKYIDFSHANAYDTLRRPLQAALNQAAEGRLDETGIMNNFIKGALVGFGDIASPFLTESIYTEALADISPLFGRGGRTAEGYEIWNPEDTWGEQAAKGFIHIMKSQLPGGIKQIGRIDYAVPQIDTWFQTGDIGVLEWGKIGRYDKNGQTYELLDEGLGLAGLRAIDINLPRTLKFKQAEYSQATRKSRSLFTKLALSEGSITPTDLVDAYINANRALFSTQKNMSQNIDAARLLNMTDTDLYTSLQRLSRKDLGYLNAKKFQPYYPSRKVLETIAINAEKVEQPNPFVEASSAINDIARELMGLDTEPNFLFPTLINPLKVEPVSALPKAEEVLTVDQTVPATTGNNLTGLQSNAMNTGQVNPMSGLTRTQEQLLSPDEKLIAQKQNQRKGIV